MPHSAQTRAAIATSLPTVRQPYFTKPYLS